jgi:two-component system, cell cycle sensor histidine kinase and response regulator CckA
MNSAVEAVARVLEVDRAEVLELASSGDVLVLMAGAGWDGQLEGEASLGVAGDSPAGCTLASQAPVVVEDSGTETRLSVPPLLADHGVAAVLNVVIRATPARTACCDSVLDLTTPG